METGTLALSQKIVQSLKHISTRHVNLMEFCGGHTVAILKYGINQLLPPTIHLLSGPGCPVCVTSTGDIDKIISLSRQPGVITAVFGDLIRVPGSQSSLQQSRADGNDVRVVYSSLEALDIARQNPGRSVIMVGIGFETTAPAIAASLIQAHQENLCNYFVLSLHKLTAPVMKALLDSGETSIDGIICPGHVSTIIGSVPYDFIPRDYHIGCAVTGFEAFDILQGIFMLVKQLESHRPDVEIAYRRAVRPEGNLRALEIMRQVFEVSSACWRGIGAVPSSGLVLNAEYQEYDAEKRFKLDFNDTRETRGCICGDILRAVKTPADCLLFKTACTPEHPVGPCMVSAEGACSAYFLYGERSG
jgi:hydrogenase expression/formation protein HypD